MHKVTDRQVKSAISSTRRSIREHVDWIGVSYDIRHLIEHSDMWTKMTSKQKLIVQDFVKEVKDMKPKQKHKQT